MSKISNESEACPEALVAFLVVLLLMVVFVQQSGLLGGREEIGDPFGVRLTERQTTSRNPGGLQAGL
jgi:hypothetical protein